MIRVGGKYFQGLFIAQNGTRTACLSVSQGLQNPLEFTAGLTGIPGPLDRQSGSITRSAHYFK